MKEVIINTPNYMKQAIKDSEKRVNENGQRAYIGTGISLLIAYLVLWEFTEIHINYRWLIVVVVFVLLAGLLVTQILLKQNHKELLKLYHSKHSVTSISMTLPNTDIRGTLEVSVRGDYWFAWFDATRSLGHSTESAEKAIDCMLESANIFIEWHRQNGSLEHTLATFKRLERYNAIGKN